MLISAVGSGGNGLTKGQTYDGIFPFTGSVANFNSVYWARLDTLLGYLRDNGITAVLYPMDNWTCDDGEWFAPADISDAQAIAYGAAIAARYPRSTYPNILWAGGGDFQGWRTDRVNVHLKVLQGIRSTGDTRPYTMQWHNHSHSTGEIPELNGSNVGFNFVYSYQPTYDQIYKAYTQTGTGLPIPAILMEQQYELSVSAATMRRVRAWTLTSGGAGAFYGHADVWGVGDNAYNYLDAVGVFQHSALMAFFKTLPKWHLLVPDVGASFVTSGRGTRFEYGADGPVSNEDSLGNYVTAAVTPDKTLAVIYHPDTSASNITLNASAVGTNPTLRRVDPSNGASTTMTWTTTPTAGANAAGDRDWFFVIEAT